MKKTRNFGDDADGLLETSGLQTEPNVGKRFLTCGGDLIHFQRTPTHSASVGTMSSLFQVLLNNVVDPAVLQVRSHPEAANLKGSCTYPQRMLGATTSQPTAPSSYIASPVPCCQQSPMPPPARASSARHVWTATRSAASTTTILLSWSCPPCAVDPAQKHAPSVKDLGIDSTLTLHFLHDRELVNTTLCRRLRKFGKASSASRARRPTTPN